MNNTSFYEPALEVLQDLAREPVATIEELRKLQTQLSNVIVMIEKNELVTMTEQERIDHASRFGPGAFVVGEFVIKRRLNL